MRSKEPYTELGLERENLPRRRRLAHAQPRPRACDAAGLGDADEGVKVAEVSRR